MAAQSHVYRADLKRYMKSDGTTLTLIGPARSVQRNRGCQTDFGMRPSFMNKHCIASIERAMAPVHIAVTHLLLVHGLYMSL